MKGDDSQEPYIVSGYRRIDNITDWGLTQFRQQYNAAQIRKDDIWHYLYGLLHVPQYRERYQADLSKDLPRMPLVSSFDKVRAAGGELADLHLDYETCPLYPLEVEVKQGGDDTYRLGPRPMQWGGSRKDPDRSVLQVTPRVTLRGIPDAAHLYVVNGRTPLGVGRGPPAYPPGPGEWDRERSQRVVRQRPGSGGGPPAAVGARSAWKRSELWRASARIFPTSPKYDPMTSPDPAGGPPPIKAEDWPAIAVEV